MTDTKAPGKRGGALDAAVGLALVGVFAVAASKERTQPTPPITEPPAPIPVPEATGPPARIDSFQQRHAVTAFPIAVVKKFGDDRAGRLAALVAYYSFFSLFPMLLVAVTVIGYIFGDEDAQELRDSALAQIPVVGEQISSQIGGLGGSGIALVIGLATALWAGLGAMQSAQDAMNEIWNVPRVEQPPFLKKRLRSLLALIVVGLSLGAGMAAAQFTAFLPELPLGGRVLGVAITVGINVLVFWISFQVLTTHHRTWRELLPGAVVAGIGYALLQFVGGWYVDRTISGASDTYGTFAVVIGLLAWLYLLAQMACYAAEVNVVKARRLWPRSLIMRPATKADANVQAATTKATRQRPDTHITVETPRAGDRPDATTPTEPPPPDETAAAR